MANQNTKQNRKLTGYGRKRGHALNTSALRAEHGKKPWEGARKEAKKNGVI